MKRVLTAFMIIGLMAAALTGCTAKKDEPTSTPPLTISEDVSVGNEVTETLDTREGEPMPTNIIPESYPEYPMDVTFFTGTADIFAKVPDISAAIRDTPAKMEFSSGKLESVYTPTDVNAAIAAVGDMLLQADFVVADNVNAQLDLDDPDSAPEPGDIVYLRAADGIFISLTDQGGNLVARYRQGSSYYAGGKPVAIEPSGNNGSNYKGVLFDRAPFDYVAEHYGNYVPEPNNPLGTPAYISFIDSDHGVAGYVFKIDNPDARAESFKMTMEDAGFTTESFAAENSTYIKASIKVSLEIVKKTSVFSEATVTLETLPGSNAGDPALRYESSALGIGIVFPPEYKDKYAIVEHDDSFSVVHKVSNKALNGQYPNAANDDRGTLFWIQRLPLSDIDEVMEDVGNVLMFKTDRYGYLFRRPTDVQFDDSDPYGLSETEYHMLYSGRLARVIIDSAYALKNN